MNWQVRTVARMFFLDQESQMKERLLGARQESIGGAWRTWKILTPLLQANIGLFCNLALK